MHSRLLNFATQAAIGAVFCAAAIGPASAEPALWRIKNGDTTMYLFGSVHVLPSDVKWRGSNVDAAIKASNVFVWEAPGSISMIERRDRFVSDNGVLPRGKTLSKMLSPQGLKDYKEVLKRTGAEPEVVNVSRPWRAWYLLESGGLRLKADESAEDMGDASFFYGVDLTLQQEADKKIKEAKDDPEKPATEKRFFETDRHVFEYFEKELPDDHIQDFEKHLHQLLNDKSTGKFKELVTEWSRGNVAFIAKENLEDAKEFPLQEEMILHQRNLDWIPQIEKMLTEKKTFFVTVGAAHLAGKDSLIDILCGKGIKIERLNGPGGSGCAAVAEVATASPAKTTAKKPPVGRQVAIRR